MADFTYYSLESRESYANGQEILETGFNIDENNRVCSIFHIGAVIYDEKISVMTEENLPPSQKPFWIGGHFRQFRKDPTGFLTSQSRLADVSSFRMASLQGFLINHPEMIRDMLVVNAHKFIKGRALQRAKNLLGEGLLTSEGASHLRQRGPNSE